MRRFCHGALLALAAFFTFLSAMPVADPPVKIYDSAAALIPLTAILGAFLSWAWLFSSRRRNRDLAAVCFLNLLALVSLCRALGDILACYSYYVTG